MIETIKVPSVNALESLVPPVDLCSKIPDGIFADSALIWCYDGDFWHVEARATSFYNKEEDIRPAPTLQEILAELHNYHLKKFGKDSPSDIIVKRDPENFSPYFANHSPVVAALKLYLNLSYDQSDQSDQSVPSVPSVSQEAQP